MLLEGQLRQSLVASYDLQHHGSSGRLQRIPLSAAARQEQPDCMPHRLAQTVLHRRMAAPAGSCRGMRTIPTIAIRFLHTVGDQAAHMLHEQHLCSSPVDTTLDRCLQGLSGVSLPLW